MPTAIINGLPINYAVHGNGPPMIMLSPGGFDSNIDGWSSRSVWKDLRPLETLAKEFTMIAYDRREAGQSGGRVEPHTWYMWAAEAVGLLDHLKIDRAWVIGGCMGVSVASAIGAHFPERCLGLLMHWPVGGFRWRAKGHLNFDKHILFARANGLAAVAARAKKAAGFWADPESGPWATVLAQNEAFAAKYVKQDLEQYLAVVAYSRDTVFDDTMPSGATGEQLMAIKLPSFIMSGDDASHATSAAHALRELIPGSVLSPLMPPQQNAATVTAWIRESVAAVKA
ncbi:MAG TPA: alpha/beta hydrolase [Burkholderiales bacterium]|jgi:pimeloyl-ACP methyl ester carboxylesterase|nr:alpha/beta hydrolase [Burkholderiales bacterium]